jgi:hypothetical protein
VAYDPNYNDDDDDDDERNGMELDEGMSEDIEDDDVLLVLVIYL